MMQSKERITRENVMDILRRFAREYRKALGKTPAEIIIVGGGSIMLNYTFRDATQDLDVILHAASGTKDVDTGDPDRFRRLSDRDENGSPQGLPQRYF